MTSCARVMLQATLKWTMMHDCLLPGTQSPATAPSVRTRANDNADGPFVYMGFRPAFVMTKASNANRGLDYLTQLEMSITPVDNLNS